MPVNVTRAQVRALCQPFGDELYRPGPNQVHFLVHGRQKLHALCQRLHRHQYGLVTVVANDERELEDTCFKVYYVFAHPTADAFLIVENPLPAGEDTYLSIAPFFPGVDVFEREMADLMGLTPNDPGRDVPHGHWLHEQAYPPGLAPLRRDRTTAQLQRAIAQYRQERTDKAPAGEPPPPDGQWILPVGPVHAGVIEPGHFRFRLAGEVVEELSIRLGYTHKGTERLFQVRHTLADGWQLAEHVAGDAAFAHSLAYCRAVEALAQATVPAEATLLRGLFLELERLTHHVADCGALAHDVALDVVAAEIAVHREKLRRLAGRLAGHRLLRGLNRPGGLVLPHPLPAGEVQTAIAQIVDEFLALAHLLQQMPDFRDRVIDTGILTQRQAETLGATGLVARASGVDRDARRRHPAGIFRRERYHALLAADAPPATGDVFARFLIRVHEAQQAAAIIDRVLAAWTADDATSFVTPPDLDAVPNYEFDLGVAESWRGDVVYWLMKDKFGGIYRCKVRDPSLLNWPALQAAMAPHPVPDNGKERAETILADFPLVNKSFNLSYSANDL